MFKKQPKAEPSPTAGMWAMSMDEMRRKLGLPPAPTSAEQEMEAAVPGITEAYLRLKASGLFDKEREQEMAVIEYFPFSPFPGELTAFYALKFHYSSHVADALKTINRKSEIRAKTPGGKAPCGWLTDFKLWFVRGEAWDVVRDQLQQLGYSFRDIPKPDRVREIEKRIWQERDAGTLGTETNFDPQAVSAGEKQVVSVPSTEDAHLHTLGIMSAHLLTEGIIEKAYNEAKAQVEPFVASDDATLRGVAEETIARLDAARQVLLGYFTEGVTA
jgi:hypothetical protein